MLIKSLFAKTENKNIFTSARTRILRRHPCIEKISWRRPPTHVGKNNGEGSEKYFLLSLIGGLGILFHVMQQNF